MKQRLLRLVALLLVAVLVGTVLVTLTLRAASANTTVTEINFNNVQMGSDSYGLEWNVTASGGSSITSSSYRLSSTIGQPAAANFASPSFEHRAGYWQEWIYRLLLPIILRN
jgi:hypothetical protein